MNLLHTVLHLLITGSTATMHEHLVIRVLETTCLRYRQSIIDESHGTIYSHEISHIEVRRTRRTNTVFRTFNSNGIGCRIRYLAPIGCITIYIDQSYFRQLFIVQMHTRGIRSILCHVNVSLARNSYHIFIYIQHLRALVQNGTQIIFIFIVDIFCYGGREGKVVIIGFYKTR